MRSKLLISGLLVLALTGLALPLDAPSVGAQPTSSTVQITVVTGADGTENPLLVTLFGPGGADPVPVWYVVLAAGAGDLQPNQTNTYTFQVPLGFCDLIKVELRKPASPGIGDDAWALQEFYISVDGVQVAFDTTAWEYFSPQTVTAYPFNLRWDGTQQYQDRCSGQPLTVLTIVPSGGLLVVTPLSDFQPPPLAVTLAPPPMQPGQGSPQPTLPPPAVITEPPPIVTLPPAITAPPQQGQTVNCPGFNLTSRLQVGQRGRVLPGIPNRIRAQPTTSSAQVGLIPGGGEFDILAGPTCGPTGILWWKVNYAGQIGWTGEGQGSTYWCEPAN
jgi:hypothetical protein